MSEPNSETPQSRHYRRFDSMKEHRETKQEEKPQKGEVADRTALDSLTTANLEQNSGADNMSEAGELDESQPLSSLEPGQSRKEFEQPIQAYRDLLSACFDENGNFATQYRKTGKYTFWEVWKGEHILADVLHEPDATQYQALLLGTRPLFFFDAHTVVSDHPYEEKQRFFKEEGINLGIHTISSGDGRKSFMRTIWRNVAIYNPELVKGVLEKNQDVFGDYKGQPIEEYFNGVVEWDTVVPFIGIDPLASYPDTNWHRWEKPLRLYEEIIREIKGQHPSLITGPGTDAARLHTLRLGLLLGFPRDVLERAIDDRAKAILIKGKFIEQHNKLLRSNDEVAIKYKKLWGDARDKALALSGHEQYMAWPSLEKIALMEEADEFFSNLTEEERIVFNNDPYLKNRRSPSPLIDQFNDQVKSVVDESGIKIVQKEFAQRYRALKMRGLIGVLRRRLGIKTRAEDPSSA